MYEYKAKVVNVVDGDTIDLVVDMGFYMTATIRSRLLGINTPEIHGETKNEGLLAKAYVSSRLLNNEVTIKTTKADSFGRWLCTVFIGEENFNATLISMGLAVEYMK